MENNGGDAGDDQGSGWLQVKKKHRSSSKFSLQGWVGGFSGKQATNVPRSQAQANVKTGNPHGKQVVGQRGKIPVHNQGGIANASNISKEEVVVQYLDKRVVCQNEPDLKTAASCDSKDCVSEVLQRDKLATSGKSKWGDLDTEASVPHQEKIAGADIRFGDIDKDYLVSGKAEDGSSSISCIASSVETIGEILMVKSIDASQNLQEPLSLSASDRQNIEEVKEVSSEDVKIKITNEKIVDSRSDVSSCGEKCYEHVESVEIPLDASSLSGSAANELDRVITETMEPIFVSEGVEPEMLDISVTEVGPNTVLGGQDTVSQLHGKSSLESTEEPITEESGSFKDSGPQQTTQIPDSSKLQTIGCTNAGDEDESKERFRERLWCFLFDNLNRAVDELYLLCELECDVEQMKEADLVLEEAASDFKELKSRVEEFENVKKSTSQSIDGPSMALMSDHRRPHALSWEVRRMTTSPHRAEILSSSLEAFRKIQQERGVPGAGDAKKLELDNPTCNHTPSGSSVKISGRSSLTPNAKETLATFRKPAALGTTRSSLSRDKRSSDSGRSRRIILTQNSHPSLQNPSSCTNLSSSTVQDCSAASVPGKSKRDLITTSEMEKGLRNKNKMVVESGVDKNLKSVDHLRKAGAPCESDMDKKNGQSWKSMDAWKEKRNWEDILATPCRASSRFMHSPGVGRRSAERARVLHDKLLSPEKKKKTSVDLKKEAEEKHARAMRIRNELENERIQKLQRNSEKVNRVSEWQAVRNMKLREGMYARHQRSESRHEAFLAQVARRAGDESSKVNEVRFITSLTEENKKLILRQKLHDSELRRAEKLLLIKTKQKEDTAREEAVLERKKLIEAEKLQRLAEIQRKKEEALARREEERKASSAAREAKAMEQLRRKEVRVKAQQEEAELLAQKLAERLRESEQRRKFYLEQIRERASMDFRDQASPLLRRPLNKDSQGRSTATSNGEECQVNNLNSSGDSLIQTGSVTLQPLLKRRIKKIRQRLMTSKYEFVEPPVGVENSGIGYRSALGTARAKVGRWLQELQRLRQARKEGASSIGLITAEMIKFMEGKDPELQASRQAGLLDFIASALPASQTSRPEACQFTIYLLRLLRVVLSAPVNKSYFIAQNLLPPIIPMLAAAVENYIKIAAASNVPGGSNLLSAKTCVEGLEPTSEALDGFLWTVATIIGHVSSDERQLQMQDGLQELLLAYQVIHRLRDLFALHDRPQVEGLPFPSSILLSINLLVVLTSRSRTHFSIDWESFPQTILEDNTFRDKLVETADLGHSPVKNSSGDSRPQLCALIGSIPVSLPDVPEDRPLDVSCTGTSSTELALVEKYSNKLEVVGTISHISEIPDEPDLVSTDKHAVTTLSQKEEKSYVDVVEQNSNSKLPLKTPVKFLLSAISETGLVCLPSLLTAVLLQANNRLSSEQGSHVLPSNFEEVATGVLKVFNNLALIDIGFMQRILARPDLKMEFFHLMSFLLSYCTSKWGVATDQVGLLLLESLSLLGYFALLQPGNQAVLRWGKSPTILHKICDLPFVFFSDPELMPVLAGTLVAACYGCEQNKGVVQLELSTDMLLSLLRSCRNGLSSPAGPVSTHECSSDSGPVKPNRSSLRGSSNRVSSGKSSSSGNSSRISKVKTHKDNKTSRANEETMPVKQNQPILENSYSFMLHSRFTESFIDRAEQFFAAV